MTASCHSARQYVTKQDDLPTSRPANNDTVGAIDLGWREPEKVKGGKKKGSVAVDATDSTDASERPEDAKVRLVSTLLNIFIFREDAGQSNTSAERAVGTLTPGPYVTIRGT